MQPIAHRLQLGFTLRDKYRTDLYARKISPEARCCTRSSAATCLFIPYAMVRTTPTQRITLWATLLSCTAEASVSAGPLESLRSAIQVLIAYATTFDTCSFIESPESSATPRIVTLALGAIVFTSKTRCFDGSSVPRRERPNEVDESRLVRLKHHATVSYPPLGSRQ